MERQPSQAINNQHFAPIMYIAQALGAKEKTYANRPIRPNPYILRILQRPSRIPHNTMNRKSR